MKDVITAAGVIADRHMAGLKIDDIKEAMISAMLEYADLRERKQENDAEQHVSNNEVAVCEFNMNPDDCIRKADTCFKCLK